MNRRLKILILTLLTTLAIDVLWGFAFDRLLSHAKGGETANEHYIVSNSIEDVMIFGSSRALHHYVPAIIEDSLDVSCYNCGIEGTGIITALGRWELMKKHHVPRLIIYDINSFDYLKDDYSKYTYFLKPYIKDEDVFSLLQSISPKESFKLKSNLYRYNSRFLQIIKDNIKNDSSLKDAKGYEALSGSLDANSLLKDSFDSVQIDEFKISLISKLIQEVKASGSEIVFVYSPYYGQTPANEIYPVQLEHLFEDLEVKFYDFRSDERFSTDSSLFNDRFHLNNAGAELFTRVIISMIDSKS